MNTKVSVVVYSNYTDLRLTGSNLSTGCKAHFQFDGKERRKKIYMTNTGSCLWFYIKWGGKNLELTTEDVIYQTHIQDLIDKNWTIGI